MNEERDPLLDSLFATASEELASEYFLSAVMARVKNRNRRLALTRLGIAALLVALELLLSSPLQNTVGLVTDLLASNLYQFNNEWIAFMLAPLNSLAGLLGLLLLALHFMFRRMFT
jgi:hypothetical protein